MNKHFTQNILRFLLLIAIALSSGCGQSTATDSQTSTPVPSQTLTETATPSPTNTPRLNGYLVYSDAENVFLFNFQDETVKPIYHVGEKYPFSEPFVDNNAIYFLSHIRINGAEGDLHQLYRMNFDGTDVEQLTADSESALDKFDLSGSPNGKKLAYIQTGNSYSLVIFDKNTKAVDVIIDKDGFDYYLPSWSLDGGKVIFFKADVKERTTSYVLRFGSMMIYSVDTGEINELLPGEIVPIVKSSWSPDGKTIVFSRMVGAEFISVDICTLNIQNGIVEKLVSGQRNTGQQLFNYYNWAPNDNLIVYEYFFADQLFIFDLKRSETISVGYLDFRLGAHGGLWSPDGRYIAYIIGPNQDPANTDSKRLTLLNIQDTETGELFQFKIPWGKYMRMASWIYP